MKVKTLQVHWHEKQPIFSCDFEHRPGGRLATAGGDAAVRIWRFDAPKATEPPQLVYLATLKRHTTQVNVVRWHPSKDILASSGDDGNVYLWQPTANDTASAGNAAFGEEQDEGAVEQWSMICQCRNAAEVYDLAWSPCGRFFVTGSLDNQARLWDAQSGKCLQILKDHSHFVQGVAWSSDGQIIATQSSDRSTCLYRVQYTADAVSADLLNKSNRVDFPPEATQSPQKRIDQENMVQNGTEATKPTKTTTLPKSMRIYQDEMLTSFVRRLAFSPDSAILVAPCGVSSDRRIGTFPDKVSSESLNHVAWLYLRGALDLKPYLELHRGPQLCYPNFKRAPVVVRFNPNRYALQHASSSSTVKLPLQQAYRSIFAVGTQDTIYIYDTEHTRPIACFGQLHYATYNDLAWSRDGLQLLAASADGFCSLICFEKGELGEVLPVADAMEQQVSDALAAPIVASAPAPTPFPAQPSLSTAPATIIHQPMIKRVTPQLVTTPR